MIVLEYEKFNAKILQIGNSAGIIIPQKVAEYGGYSIGDTLKILSKKEVKQNEKKVL